MGGTLLFFSTSQAQPATVQAPFLQQGDTIFLHVDPQSGKWFPHTLRPGQTLYSIAQFYGISLNELYAWNPEFRNRSYHESEQVRIPIPNRAIIRYRSPRFSKAELLPVCYIVRKGDTVFGIAKRIFHMPIDTILRRNQLQSYNIEVGQALHVGWMSIHGIPDSLRQNYKGPLWEKSYQLKSQFDGTALHQSLKVQQGPARWISKSLNQTTTSPNQSTTALYALHNQAAKSSIIAVENPMTGRKVFVKVLGKIPSNYDPRTIVLISPEVARMLGVLDEKFYARVHYF